MSNETLQIRYSGHASSCKCHEASAGFTTVHSILDIHRQLQSNEGALPHGSSIQHELNPADTKGGIVCSFAEDPVG